MKLKHRVESPYTPTFRTNTIASMFDVTPEEKLAVEWDVDFPIEDHPDWQIGLIIGPSGSGKTTLAKRLFGAEAYHEGFAWGSGSVLDDFPKALGVKDITEALSSVGFSSPPAWLRPFHVLSNGQKFRAEIARLIADPEKELVVLDEFTSVVDRQVARFSCAAVERYIRSTKTKFVGVSCHDDIIPWLQPDWVYDVSTGQMLGRGSLRRRPPIEVEIFRANYSAWRLFSGHHYLSADIHRASHVYVGTIEGEPVALIAAMAMPHPRLKNAWRSHRSVVLPDWQGLRIGVAMNDAIGEHYTRIRGGRFFGLASHHAMVTHRNNSPRWMLRRNSGMVGKPGKSGKWTNASVGRASVAHEYVGHLEERAGLIAAYDEARAARTGMRITTNFNESYVI
jgi:energy-coupling factor transporter ATP-binding protein EcfA2